MEDGLDSVCSSSSSCFSSTRPSVESAAGECTEPEALDGDTLLVEADSVSLGVSAFADGTTVAGAVPKSEVVLASAGSVAGALESAAFAGSVDGFESVLETLGAGHPKGAGVPKSEVVLASAGSVAGALETAAFAGSVDSFESVLETLGAGVTQPHRSAPLRRLGFLTFSELAEEGETA